MDKLLSCRFPHNLRCSVLISHAISHIVTPGHQPKCRYHFNAYFRLYLTIKSQYRRL